MSIEILIQKLTPHYNKYRENKKNISATEALEIMWEMGDILNGYIAQNKIAPHNLFWSVYGRSEGTKNIVQKSYITREFQNRCHRIRRIFESKAQIRSELPHLRSFTAFREAMPFFDNGKHKLKGAERSSLLALLNSGQPPQKILEQIKVLQKNKIGIHNPRTQRLHEVEKEKNLFEDFYNHINEFYKSGSYDNCLREISKIDTAYIRTLSQNVRALTQEGLRVTQVDIPDSLVLQWRDFNLKLNNLLTDRDARRRRRFRRVVPVSKIVRLSDLLYGLLSEANFNIVLTKFKS